MLEYAEQKLVLLTQSYFFSQYFSLSDGSDIPLWHKATSLLLFGPIEVDELSSETASSRVY